MSVMKRRKVMLLAVIAAIAVFAVSAFAASANISGYERLKAAGFQLAEQMNRRGGSYSNGVFAYNVSYLVNGDETVSLEQATMRDGARTVTRKTSKFYASPLEDLGIFESSYYDEYTEYTDDEVIYRWNSDGSFSENKVFWNRYGNYKPGYGDAGGEDEYEERIPPAQRRFIEALADTLIGETRNYFVADGNSVRISLSGNQIPELAQYAIAALTERMDESMTYIHDGEGVKIGGDARFTSGSLTVELDDANNFVGAKVSVEVMATVNGKLSSYLVLFEYASEGVGSTVITRPDKGVGGKPVLPYIGSGAVVPGGRSGMSGAFDGAGESGVFDRAGESGVFDEAGMSELYDDSALVGGAVS